MQYLALHVERCEIQGTGEVPQNQCKLLCFNKWSATNKPRVESSTVKSFCCLSDVIRLDALVEGQYTCRLLCKALRLGKDKRSLLRLRINRLEVGFMNAATLAALLDQLDQVGSLQNELKWCPSSLPHQKVVLWGFFLQDLVALCLRAIGLQCEGFRVLAPKFSKFTSLTGLDLSWNGINLVADTHHNADILGGTLAKLPLLTRLNLTGNRLTNQLQTVLGKMLASLSYLKLYGCALSKQDIIFLTRSRHASTLRGLDIGFNNLGDDFQDFLQLLCALESHLIVLETENCSFHQDHLTHLFQRVSKSHLRFWNITRNYATNVDFLQQITAISELSSLEILLVSFPIELKNVRDRLARKEFQKYLKNLLSKRFPDVDLQRYYSSLAIQFRWFGSCSVYLVRQMSVHLKLK